SNTKIVIVFLEVLLTTEDITLEIMYLYEVVAIMESLWLLSSSLNLLKEYILEDETKLLINGWVAHRSSLAVAADCKG
ncbi:hypothetical protein Tco_0870412, partial [Tanacetum coccineum]